MSTILDSAAALRGPVRSRRRAVAVALALVVVASAVAGLAGQPLVYLMVAAAAPWLVLASSRWGASIAAALSLFLSGWLVLAVLAVTPVMNVPMVPFVVIVWTVLGLAGAVACWFTPQAVRLPRRAEMGVWIPASLGGVIWLAVSITAGVLPGAANIARVMGGDSANNILFAREVIYRGGIGLGPGDNPVPLSSALMGLAMASGRDDLAAQELLRHDLVAFVQLWMLLIALTCVVAGAVAASIVRTVSESPAVVGTVAALASLLPLTWFVTGYALEFGFFNTHLALPIVFLAFLAYINSRAHPAPALAALALAATLLLTVWSPLVLIPASLGVVLLFTRRRELIATRGLELALLVFAIAQMFAHGLAVVVPSVLNLGEFLSAPGAAYGFRQSMLPLLTIAGVVLAYFALRRKQSEVLPGVVALVVASAMGLGALMAISWNGITPWSYYPLKFAWLASVILMVVIAGLVAAILVRYIRPKAIRLGAVATVGSLTLAFVVWMPPVLFGLDTNEPTVRILGGDMLGDGDEVVEQIFATYDPEQAHLLWESGSEHEGTINFWLMQMWADSLTENFELRVAAYGQEGNDVSVLCDNVRLMGGDAVIHTASPDLEKRLLAICSDVDVRLAVE